MKFIKVLNRLGILKTEETTTTTTPVILDHPEIPIKKVGPNNDSFILESILDQAIGEISVKKPEPFNRTPPKVDEKSRIEDVSIPHMETATDVVDEAPIVEVINKEPKMLPAAHVVIFENVTKQFGDKVAIKDVSFKVADIPNKGELISIVGPSGCGKSTILKIIAGLQPHFPHTSGSVLVRLSPVSGPGIDRGVVDQKYSLLPHLTVLDNIAFGLMLGGMSKKQRRAQAKEWVSKIGLDGSELKYPHELSGGMQQRVSLAATLIMHPSIILMDEPFGALDPKNRMKMQELLISLWKEIESTVFIVTHSMEEALYLGDRVFRMESNPGRLVEILTVPRPDCSPEEMRKEKWFFDAVSDLTNRVETSKVASGKLAALPT